METEAQAGGRASTSREEERRREEELKRRQKLELDAENWHKSQRLRAYIDAVEQQIVKGEGPITEDSEAHQWLVWARAHADRLDPVAECPQDSLEF